MQKSSRNPRAAVLALVALLSGPAQATLLRVDYEGIVTAVNGTGLGYSIGAPITGQFLIDASAVERTENCFFDPGVVTACDYFGSGLVLGGPAGSTSLDAVFVTDRLHPACPGCENESEGYFVLDAWTQEDGQFRTSASHSLRVFDAELDFISGNGIGQDFSLLRSGLSFYGNMFGFRSESRLLLETQDPTYDNSLRYNATSVRVAAVPLPPTALLLATALAGLAGRRITASARTARAASPAVGGTA
jgi:hypothetical protein